MTKQCLLLTFIALQLMACGQKSTIEQSNTFKKMSDTKAKNNITSDSATFGAGCFWCTEAQFQQLKGVTKVVSGYMGGSVKNPSYKEVCTGTTGHAEVSTVYFNPTIISYDELLAAFFVTHDPTQLNRQGNDIGTQYRSAVFYNNETQQKLAIGYIKKLNEEKVYPSDIVTEVSAASHFYPAEDYHQDYYQQNGEASYCKFVIQPKLEKFRKVFHDKLQE